MKKMNSNCTPIVFVIGAYKNGGVARRSTVLANEMGRHGRKVILLATKDIGKEVFFEQHENVSLISLNDFFRAHKNDSAVKNDRARLHIFRKLRKLQLRFGLTSDKKKLQNDIRYMRKSEALRCFLLSHKNSILIPFGIEYCVNTVAAAKGLGCKIIFAERNAPQLETGSEEGLAEAGLVLMKTDACIFQTNDELSYYKKYLGDTPSFVIRNPVSDSLPLPYTGIRQKKIVNFCRISKQKNIPLMLDAFSRLSKEFPDYRLLIWGNTVADIEEDLRKQIKCDIINKGLDGKAQLLPPSANIHNEVLDSAMFVSSSDFEGLSNSMLEAMAIGLPVVCTDCDGGGARELIIDGENGILVPKQDAEALYLGMKRLISDPELAEKCGLNAAKLRDDCSVKTITAAWLRVIESVSDK